VACPWEQFPGKATQTPPTPLIDQKYVDEYHFVEDAAAPLNDQPPASEPTYGIKL